MDIFLLLGVVVLLILLAWRRGGIFQSQQVTSQKLDSVNEISEKTDLENAFVATFAGGCFWCLESEFRHIKGVVDLAVGVAPYMGGPYEGAGREAVQLWYDPEIVSYADLLEEYRDSTDPTDDGGQYTDRGFAYTTAIYFHTPDQEQVARESLRVRDNSGKYDAPLVTDIIPYIDFVLADEYHQDYASKYPQRFEKYKKKSGRI